MDVKGLKRPIGPMDVKGLKRPIGPVDLNFIVRVCQCVFDELGMGHSEKVYQRGIGTLLDSLEIFNRLEVIAPTYMLGNVVGSGRIDLVVGRWVLELKAIASTQSKASGQLIKYLKSINKVKTDEFQSRRVQSVFFTNAGSRQDECIIIDDEYPDVTESVKEQLFSGAVINFNQRNGNVHVCCVLPPDHSMLLNAHQSAIVMDCVDTGISATVARFARCCLDISDDNLDSVPLCKVATAYEDFTGKPLPSLRIFKTELARHVRIEISSAIRGCRWKSDYVGEEKLVCIGVKLVT